MLGTGMVSRFSCGYSGPKDRPTEPGFSQFCKTSKEPVMMRRIEKREKRDEEAKRIRDNQSKSRNSAIVFGEFCGHIGRSALDFFERISEVGIEVFRLSGFDIVSRHHIIRIGQTGT